MRLTAYLMIMNHVLLDDIDLISAKNFSVTGSNLSCANDECRVPYGPLVCAEVLSQSCFFESFSVCKSLNS